MLSLLLNRLRWAWQHSHYTRHIPIEDRISKYRPRKKKTSAGKSYTTPGSVINSLPDKIRNLHILLRAVAFKRWPLNVRFFSRDFYEEWAKRTVEGSRSIRDGLKVALDQSAQEFIAKTAKRVPLQERLEVFDKRPATQAIYAIDASYKPAKERLRQSTTALTASNPECVVCRENLHASRDLILVCPKHDCGTLSHLNCLADRFLENDPADEPLLPSQGVCPCCRTSLDWAELVKDLTLRIRAPEEVEKLLKETKENTVNGSTMKKHKADSNGEPQTVIVFDDGTMNLPIPERVAGQIDQLGDDAVDEDDDDEIGYDASFAEDTQLELENATEYVADVSGDDLPVLASNRRKSPSTEPRKSGTTRMTVPDSEWDDIEEIT